MVDREIERAIRPAPNQYELGNLQSILAAKEAYVAADALSQNPAAYAKANGLSEDATRALAGTQMQNAQASADMSRNRLTAGGFNTGGYGAGDTLENVRNQLLSREAKDIAEVFQGAYSKTTDQYYNLEYNKAIASGLSPRRAEKLASANARKYQANRVAYLDGVYNSYGHNEAGATTPIGMQILGMIAQDNPMLAQIYGQAYPTPMNEYNNANDIAKEITKQNNLKDIMGLEQNNALERISAQLNANKEYATHNAGLNRETYATNKAVDQQYQIDSENRAAQTAEKLRQQQTQAGEAFADRYGLTGADKAKVVAAFQGINLSGLQSGQKANDDTLKNLKNLHAMLDTRIKALQDQMKNADGVITEIDPKIMQEIADAMNGQKQLEDIYSMALGTGSVNKNGVDFYSDNEETNNRSLATLWQLSNGDMGTYKQYVDHWLTKSGVTPRFKEQYLKNLKPFGGQ